MGPSTDPAALRSSTAAAHRIDMVTMTSQRQVWRKLHCSIVEKGAWDLGRVTECDSVSLAYRGGERVVGGGRIDRPESVRTSRGGFAGSETRREVSGSAVMEDAVSNGPLTRHEDSTSAALGHPSWNGGPTRHEGSSTPGWSRFNLPPELASTYQIVEELGSGGEGAVVRVVAADGAEFVVKLYFPELKFDADASSLLAEADPDHVVKIVAAGSVAQDGSRYEVQEYCAHGSLRDQLSAGRQLELGEVIRELYTALEHIHALRLADHPEARLVHQDLKPENVFVRRLEPLDLVLGDFGSLRHHLPSLSDW